MYIITIRLDSKRACGVDEQPIYQLNDAIFYCPLVPFCHFIEGDFASAIVCVNLSICDYMYIYITIVIEL